MSSLSCATAQGRRSEQQDRWVVARLDLPESPRTAGQLLAVMDGHGGRTTAEMLASELASTFEKVLKSNQKPIGLVLREAIAQLVRRTEQETSGSTLSVVFIPQDAKSAHVAVLGDSPVIIADAEGALRFSSLHNARSDLKEREAALSRGARYVDGYLEDPQVPDEGVQLSRVLGDRKLARVLSREPDIYTVALGKASWVLLATDGVLDSYETDMDEQLKHVAALAQSGQDAQGIVEDALHRQTGDNVTVILWKA